LRSVAHGHCVIEEEAQSFSNTPILIRKLIDPVEVAPVTVVIEAVGAGGYIGLGLAVRVLDTELELVLTLEEFLSVVILCS
jgi:hypothetical protein